MSHHQHHTFGSSLPHHRLVVYRKALELLAAVRAAQITDAKLRDEALRAAKGTCLNIAEAAGRVTRVDKARVYAIARGEASEAYVALDIALAAGLCDVAAATAGINHARAAYALLSGLIRKFRSGASTR